jgi:hypothetical protein
MLSESDKLLISPKFSKPHVTIQHYCHLNYWMVTIRCKDRNKLFFDTVCTLSDLNYDVYHGAIDQVRGWFGLAGLAAHKPAAMLCSGRQGLSAGGSLASHIITEADPPLCTLLVEILCVRENELVQHSCLMHVRPG